MNPRNHFRKTSGSKRRNTLEKVSWLGIPFLRGRKDFRNSRLEWTKRAMSVQVSPPQSMVQRAMTTMSCRECLPAFPCLGSSNGSTSSTSIPITTAHTLHCQIAQSTEHPPLYHHFTCLPSIAIALLLFQRALAGVHGLWWNQSLHICCPGHPAGVGRSSHRFRPWPNG